MTSTPDGTDATLQEIPAEECYRLLGTPEIGRLDVNAEHHPLIFPVNYGMDGTTIVVRTRPGTKLAAAQHANVTFEVDESDRRTRSGWSVLVRGLADEVGPEHRAELVARTHATGVQPWAPGDHGHWLRLISQQVSGRRIVPRKLPPAVDPRAYLWPSTPAVDLLIMNGLLAGGGSGWRGRDIDVVAARRTRPEDRRVGGPVPGPGG